MELRLNALIIESGWKKKHIARKADIDPARLSRIIHGDVRASDREKMALARALECRIEEIFAE